MTGLDGPYLGLQLGYGIHELLAPVSGSIGGIPMSSEIFFELQ